MNFKNFSWLSFLLIISGHTIMRSEFQITYTDAAKLMSRFQSRPMRLVPGSAGPLADTMLLVLASPVYAVSGVNSDERRRHGHWRRSGAPNLFVDSVRHHIWYNDKYLSNEELSATDVLLEPAFFAVANKSVDVAFNKLSEYDVVSNIVRSIPNKDNNFICRNGRMVALAAVARGGRILTQEGLDGLNSQNGKKFLKQAGMQVGSELTEVYIINPIVDKVVGNDDCLSGDILKVGLNAVAFYALSSLVSDRK